MPRFSLGASLVQSWIQKALTQKVEATIQPLKISEKGEKNQCEA